MIKVIAVGKIKETYLTDAITEYVKRLKPYTRLEIVQVADEKCPEAASAAQAEQGRDKEGKRILDNITDRDYVITLEIGGRKLSSEAFAKYLDELQIRGISDMVFVIGGSTGIAKAVSDRADFKLSFSDMTFPHQLMRVILLEQIYRCFKILKNEPYHK